MPRGIERQCTDCNLTFCTFPIEVCPSERKARMPVVHSCVEAKGKLRWVLKAAVNAQLFLTFAYSDQYLGSELATKVSGGDKS